MSTPLWIRFPTPVLDPADEYLQCQADLLQPPRRHRRLVDAQTLKVIGDELFQGNLRSALPHVAQKSLQPHAPPELFRLREGESLSGQQILDPRLRDLRRFRRFLHRPGGFVSGGIFHVAELSAPGRATRSFSPPAQNHAFPPSLMRMGLTAVNNRWTALFAAGVPPPNAEEFARLDSRNG